ncbi:hypothetical protein [Acetobacter oeni]|uniref:Lipoprotein n=1 Tax=Acetobacter oeni TaxID=304077 RepID=A0A511XKI2_9PROT|nr:hypothetical protein [Acetobacter oeni]MBB3881353.1 putative lipoprotein YajG [Acetobacter oeni]NHO18225.1 hypothetical protein [Acetobacter oeni]GEN63452.1 hypothetical protein AOE01nite_16760 [Acetobacter oeni]
MTQRHPEPQAGQAETRNIRGKKMRCVILLTALASLAACADNPGYQQLHPKHHHGQKPPKWFKPPKVQQSQDQNPG